MNRKSKEKIRNKIRSESGASLAAALLFFIVCAVVGSIIIAAAMSSAGRMSGITSADNQRYALESARSLIEETMLSDPEDSETDPMKRSYYENVSDVDLDSSPTKIPNLGTAPIASLNQMKLQMAESLYTQYWREVKATWNENSTQSSVSGDNSGDKGVGEKVVGWTPSGTVKAQQKMVTFDKLTTASGEVAGFVPVTATFTMRPDFSILVELQAAASAQSGEGTSSAGTANAYVMTDSFLLYPQITVDYESVLPENTAAGTPGSIGTGTAGNQRRITCKIEWLTEG
ncbi:MAG: hypothetical protein Q4G57_08015 [Bacillota bacterium]|nr:hypothetical protein [Bacillota bacterium]